MRALIGSILIVAASVSLAAPDTAVYEQAVTHAGRSAKDRERDARERTSTYTPVWCGRRQICQ